MAVSDTHAMIAGMAPRRVEGIFAFRTLSPGEAVPATAIATFHEDEGLSVIEPAEVATEHPMALITLDVHSALDGVGLTAAVATALTTEGIPCNMVAAHHHDHVFVPVDLADRAVAILGALSAQYD